MEMEPSQHCIEKLKEKMGMKGGRACRKVNLAYERGFRAENCKRSRDKKFLESRKDGTIEAIAYDGFCYIFDTDTKICVTLFRLPKSFGKKLIKKKGRTYYSASFQN